jgi:hypothetical protein
VVYLRTLWVCHTIQCQVLSKWALPQHCPVRLSHAIHAVTKTVFKSEINIYLYVFLILSMWLNSNSGPACRWRLHAGFGYIASVTKILTVFILKDKYLSDGHLGLEIKTSAKWPTCTQCHRPKRRSTVYASRFLRLLLCETVQSGRNLRTHWRNVLPPTYSTPKMEKQVFPKRL